MSTVNMCCPICPRVTVVPIDDLPSIVTADFLFCSQCFDDHHSDFVDDESSWESDATTVDVIDLTDSE